MFPRLFSMDSVTILGGSIPLSRHVIDDFRFLFYSLKKIRGTDFYLCMLESEQV